MTDFAALFTLSFVKQSGTALALIAVWFAILWLLLRVGGAVRQRVRTAVSAWVERNQLSRFLVGSPGTELEFAL